MKFASHPDPNRIALVFDARGNGGGMICPTITGGHQNRITDYTAIVVCSMRVGGMDTSILEMSAAQSNSSGELGGGNVPMVVEVDDELEPMGCTKQTDMRD